MDWEYSAYPGCTRLPVLSLHYKDKNKKKRNTCTLPLFYFLPWDSIKECSYPNFNKKWLGTMFLGSVEK
jgi:hypothetical protein